MFTVNGATAEYTARELAVKQFWRAAIRGRKREEWIRRYGLEAVARAVIN